MKTKILVLVGIAICTILLTSPALASAGYSKIYGNANEDDVLDMRDVTYIKLVIFGKKPATTFADANYDGKISMLDVGQTKLIILGKEKQLTLVDQADRTVTVPRPIERGVSTYVDCTRTVVALDACNILVGIDTPCTGGVWDTGDVGNAKVCGGGLYELPQVGRFADINMEVIVSLKPDVIFAGTDGDAANTMQEKTGTPVVCASTGTIFEQMYEEIEIIGKVLGKEIEGENLISYVNEELNKVREVTSEISDNEKPKVYLSTRAHTSRYGGFTRSLARYDPLETAGGINVAKDCAPISGAFTVDVSKEQIIAWNPDIILLTRHSLKEEPVFPVEAVLSDPDLQTLNAVKNKRVHYVMNIYWCGVPAHKNIVNAMYMAKVFHPAEFKDLDLENKGNEMYKEFLGVDKLFTEFADYTVWLREYIDSQ